MAFDEDWDPNVEEEQDYFDAAAAQRHLLIVRAFDAPRYYRTENNQDGMVWPNRSRGQTFSPFPNMVVRAAVADLDVANDDGSMGHIYPAAVLFPFTITKVAKNWVGKGPQLLMWRKGPNQTDPYELRNMRGDEAAVKAGVAFLDAHPEFLALPAPEPYDESPPNDDRGRSDDRRDRGHDDRRDSGRDDGWGRSDDRGRSNGGNRRDSGARDWGQHDDRGSRRQPPQRNDAYADDPWARDAGSRDGSFMSRSRDHHGNPQDDSDIPF